MDPDSWDVIHFEFVGILLGVIVSALLSGAETALTSLSTARAKNLLEQDKPWMQVWLDKPALVITSILLGKSTASVMVAALMVDSARRALPAEAFESWGLWLSVGLSAFILLTFSEILPKAVGKKYYEEIAAQSVRFLRVPFYLFYPLNWMYAHLTQFVLRLFGENRATPGPITFDEIEYMLQERGENIHDDDRDRLLRSVVEFPETVVREVMVPRTDIVAISRDMKYDEIIDRLVECGHSRLPVYDESIDDIVGVIYAKDIINYWADHREIENLTPDKFQREPYFVPEGKHIADLLAEFQGQRIHMAIVVDEFGGTAGIITLEDIIEEIFGDIQDEFDAEPTQIREMGDERLIADARVPIYEIEEYYEIELDEHPDYESLGGFVLAQAGSVPAIGDEFTVMGLKFSVLDADPKKVISIGIERVDDEQPPFVRHEAAS